MSKRLKKTIVWDGWVYRLRHNKDGSISLLVDMALTCQRHIDSHAELWKKDSLSFLENATAKCDTHDTHLRLHVETFKHKC